MVLRKKVVIVGDGACGKTCLAVVFSRNEFPEHYAPTVYDNYLKTITVDGHNIELSIWDTAGEEDYDRLRPLSYSRANVILICYSIDNPASLTNVMERWVPELKHFCKKVPFILVGNKLDLRSNNNVVETLEEQNLHPVKYEEGMKIAKKISAKAFFECSAKYSIGIKDIFTMAAQVKIEEKTTKRFPFCFKCSII